MYEIVQTLAQIGFILWVFPAIAIGLWAVDNYRLGMIRAMLIVLAVHSLLFLLMFVGFWE